MVGYDSGILSEGYGITPRLLFKDKRLSGGAKLVYTCLSSYGSGHTDDRTVWPSINTMCEECGLSNKTVIKHLKSLEELGYIKILKQTRNDGGYSNNVYVLSGTIQVEKSSNYTTPSGVSTQGVVESVPYPSGVSTQGLVDSVHTNNTNKTIPYNNTNKTNMVSFADQESTAERFEKLWKLYPRKSRKKDAFNAYKRAIKKGVTDEEIKAGIENYNKQIKSQHTESQFIAQGGTWFNQERWNDEYTTQSGSDLGEYSRGEEYEGLW